MNSIKIKKKNKFIKGQTVLVNVEKNKFIPAKIEKIVRGKYFVKYIENNNIEKYGNKQEEYFESKLKTYNIITKNNKNNKNLNINKETMGKKTIRLKIKKKKNNKNSDIPPPIQPVFWILQNNKRFPSWINETFVKYKLSGKNKTTATSNKFKPFLYQLFLKDYMQNASPYRGILLLHSLGSGKTCSAITIAENLKNQKNIIFISPASIKGNFIEKGLLFCGDEKYKTNKNLIYDKYTFVSSNASNTIQQLNALPSLDNHVIILEEAHNIISRMVGGLNGTNKQGKAIYEKLMNARDCKIIALTGTPVVNEPYEAAILMNVLRGYMYVITFQINYVSPKYGTHWNLDRLKEELEKIPNVDYCIIHKNTKTIDFNFRIMPWHPEYPELLEEITETAKKMDINIQYISFKQYTLFPDGDNEDGMKNFNKYFIEKNDVSGQAENLKNIELLRRRMMGLISYYKPPLSKNYPKIILDEFIEVNMSPYQFTEYQKVRREEKASRKLSEIRVFTRQYSNFVFPPEIPRPGIGEKIEKNKNKNDKERNKQNEKIAEVITAADDEGMKNEIKKEELKKYQKAVDLALKKLKDGSKEYLVKDKLQKLSPKMKEMLINVDKSKGLVFVYSDFKTLEGIGIFAMVLEANGYSKYGNKDDKPKYAFYTGSEDFDERNEVIKKLTSPDNKYGKHIKIILATSAGAEGLDLKNIRQVHIMEPYWNEVRAKQVIGRAVRRDSHKDLPPDERNVSVFRYLSVISPEEQATLRPKDRTSTDLAVLDIARKKEKLTEEMLSTMHEVSVDCILNSADNQGNITCFNFGEDIDGIAYIPNLDKDVSRGVEAETRQKEVKLRIGAIDSENIVYFLENKKVYKSNDLLKRNPLNKMPKFKKKVALDLDKRVVYDYATATKQGTKLKVGYFNNKGQYYKQ